MKTLKESLRRLEEIEEVTDSVAVKQTAEHLEGKQYYPLLLFPVKNFFFLDKEQIAAELQHLHGDPAVTDEFKEMQSNLILTHFELVNRLRRDDPEAWDALFDMIEDD